MTRSRPLLTPVKAEHADRLYALLETSSVVETIVWDGPASLDAFRSEMKDRELRVARGALHQFTILDPHSGNPIGSASVRTGDDPHSAELGLWIGEPFQGRGIGTAVVHELMRYAFDRLHVEKISAHVFVGNVASRRIFEKCGFTLEKTTAGSVLKRGKRIDEWIMSKRS